MDTTCFSGALMTRCCIHGIPEDAISWIGCSDDSTGASTRVDTDPQFDGGTVKWRENSLAAIAHSNRKVGHIGSVVDIAIRESTGSYICVAN
jgi:hypothetical protein